LKPPNFLVTFFKKLLRTYLLPLSKGHIPLIAGAKVHLIFEFANILLNIF
jgi:hypothetical protein